MVFVHIFSKDTHYFYIMMCYSRENINFCEKDIGNNFVLTKKAHFLRESVLCCLGNDVSFIP